MLIFKNFPGVIPRIPASERGEGKGGEGRGGDLDPHNIENGLTPLTETVRHTLKRTNLYHSFSCSLLRNDIVKSLSHAITVYQSGHTHIFRVLSYFLAFLGRWSCRRLQQTVLEIGITVCQ